MVRRFRLFVPTALSFLPLTDCFFSKSMVRLKKAFILPHGVRRAGGRDAFEIGRLFMESRTIKLYNKNTTVPLKVVPGHFATIHSHVNY